VAAKQGRADSVEPDPASSLLKIRGSQLQQAATELLVELAGPFAMAAPARGAGANNLPGGFDWVDAAAPSYFNNRKVSIYGGSNEIQHNVIAKGILGL
jgi:alkylation response protein AidB-like acyl-CoA dehydrogenase